MLLLFIYADATEIMSDTEKKKIQRLHDELDDNFDGSDGRNEHDDDFVPFQSRCVFSNLISHERVTILSFYSRSMDEDSQMEAKENSQHARSETVNNVNLKGKKRNSSTSSAPKRKSNPKSVDTLDFLDDRLTFVSLEPIAVIAEKQMSDQTKRIFVCIIISTWQRQVDFIAG